MEQKWRIENDIKGLILQFTVEAKIKEEECIKGILRQILGKEPEISDFNDCQYSFKNDRIDKFLFSYKGECLGAITKTLGPTKYRIVFTPGDTDL